MGPICLEYRCVRARGKHRTSYEGVMAVWASIEQTTPRNPCSFLIYSILGLHRDNGKENGSYYSTLELHRETPRFSETEQGNPSLVIVNVIFCMTRRYCTMPSV